MKAVAFFNNKRGVGTTSLVYHLAWMFADKGQRVLVADLDPQASLSGMLLSEETLESIWQGDDRKTIEGDIKPLFDRTGDISSEPYIKKIDEKIGLLPGDLRLSTREDELAAQWSKCLDGDPRAFRVTTAFARLIDHACRHFPTDIALIDVGPNLGAINRAALIASDYVVIPLAPDLFSLQGLRNVGPTLQNWRKEWSRRKASKPNDLEVELPAGDMQSLGYVLMKQTVYLYRPAQTYGRWIEKMPAEYQQSVLEQGEPEATGSDSNDHLLVQVKDYRTLVLLAQEARKPMFKLKPADGVMSGQHRLVHDCYKDFELLYKKVTQAAKG